MKRFKYFVYILVYSTYVMNNYIMIIKIVESNVYLLVGSEQESESDDSTEVKRFALI